MLPARGSCEWSRPARLPKVGCRGALADNPSRQEGLAVGGSSGSALAGALKFLKSEEGKAIAEDPTANVVVVFPDGVRNYMSKEWFLKQEEGSRDAELHDTIRGIIGRELDDPYLKKKAAADAAKANGSSSDSAKPNGVHATAA